MPRNYDREDEILGFVGYAVFLLVLAAAIFVGIQINKGHEAQQCEDLATSLAFSLYQRALDTPDPELARHLGSLADASVASIELTCKG